MKLISPFLFLLLSFFVVFSSLCEPNSNDANAYNYKMKGFRPIKRPSPKVRLQNQRQNQTQSQKGNQKKNKLYEIRFIPKPLPTERTFRNETALRIAYGSNVQASEYSHQVALLRNSYVVCGGVLIGNQWVLTAAHCADDEGSYGIKAGVTDLYDSSSGQTVSASQKVIHPDWNSANLRNDIALIKLETPLTLGTTVKPATLKKGNYAVNELVKVSGWGKIESGLYPGVLKAVEVPVVSHTLCDPWGDCDDVSMICAGDGSGKDACNGDSGGPLGQFVNDQFVVGGLVSWGPSNCGASGNRGVYTKVSNYLSWIQSVTGIV